MQVKRLNISNMLGEIGAKIKAVKPYTFYPGPMPLQTHVAPPKALLRKVSALYQAPSARIGSVLSTHA